MLGSTASLVHADSKHSQVTLCSSSPKEPQSFRDHMSVCPSATGHCWGLKVMKEVNDFFTLRGSVGGGSEANLRCSERLFYFLFFCLFEIGFVCVTALKLIV